MLVDTFYLCLRIRINKETNENKEKKGKRNKDKKFLSTLKICPNIVRPSVSGAEQARFILLQVGGRLISGDTCICECISALSRLHSHERLLMMTIVSFSGVM